MDKETKPDEATHEAEQAEATHSHTADRAPTSAEEAAADRSLDSLDGDERQAAEEHYEEMTDIGAHVKGEGSVD
jgi:hypothetical protein